MEEIDLSKELKDFYENNKQEKSITNWEETLKKTKGFFGLPNFLKFNVGGDVENKIEDLKFKILHTSSNILTKSCKF
jgi:NifU-like protein involved in Fe-S cluster formation